MHWSGIKAKFYRCAWLDFIGAFDQLGRRSSNFPMHWSGIKAKFYRCIWLNFTGAFDQLGRRNSNFPMHWSGLKPEFYRCIWLNSPSVLDQSGCSLQYTWLGGYSVLVFSSVLYSIVWVSPVFLGPLL